MSQYFLTPHVYLCVTDDHGVLLDLKRDKYLGLGRPQMQALGTCVKGWPVPAGAEGAPPDTLISKMLASGMLTPDASLGKEAKVVEMPRPEAALIEPDLESKPKVTARQVLHFLQASITARLLLRWRPIEAVVSRVHTRKRRRSTAGSIDTDMARNLVDAFLYLRPLLFAARDQCLFDSLALTEYLARFGLYATWVFGVQTGPFAAHCWVQHGDVIFNDTPDNVRRFTPILTI